MEKNKIIWIVIILIAIMIGSGIFKKESIDNPLSLSSCQSNVANRQSQGKPVTSCYQLTEPLAACIEFWEYKDGTNNQLSSSYTRAWDNDDLPTSPGFTTTKYISFYCNAGQSIPSCLTSRELIAYQCATGARTFPTTPLSGYNRIPCAGHDYYNTGNNPSRCYNCPKEACGEYCTKSSAVYLWTSGGTYDDVCTAGHVCCSNGCTKDPVGTTCGTNMMCDANADCVASCTPMTEVLTNVGSFKSGSLTMAQLLSNIGLYKTSPC